MVMWRISFCMANLSGLLLLAAHPAASAKMPINSNAAAPGAVLAAWSQIVGNSTSDGDVYPLAVVARFVVQGAKSGCGHFQLRSASAQPARMITPQVRQNPDETSFPVTLCQAVLPVSWKRALLQTPNGASVKLWTQVDGSNPSTGPEVNLPGPFVVGRKQSDAMTMISIGDTGCRADSKQPHCSLDADDWPFYQLAQMAATDNPDLVIHVGDYRYYDEGNTPDTWVYWYQDFFFAAEPLLLNAPWAFSRGNHEQCHNSWAPYWYGKGWYFFFEPTTSHNTATCPPNPKTVQVDPWYFDVGSKGEKVGQPHRFIMFDTAPDTPQDADAKKAFLDKMSANFTTAINVASAVKSAWWTTHRPVISLAFYDNAWHYTDDNVRLALDAALQGQPALCKGSTGACSPSAVLAGHIHFYQNIDFFAPGTKSGHWVWPRQIITGNGGVVNVGGLNASPCVYSKFPLDVHAQGVVSWDIRHGYIVWHRSLNGSANASGWTAKLKLIGTDAPKPGSDSTLCAPAGGN